MTDQTSNQSLTDGIKWLRWIADGHYTTQSQMPAKCAEAVLAELRHLSASVDHMAGLAGETTEPLKECPYCKRPSDSEGSIWHVGGCAGLEKVELNRLQYDALVRKGSPERAGDSSERYIDHCGDLTFNAQLAIRGFARWLDKQSSAQKAPAEPDPWALAKNLCTCPKPGTSNSSIDPMCPVGFPHPWDRDAQKTNEDPYGDLPVETP